MYWSLSSDTDCIHLVNLISVSLTWRGGRITEQEGEGGGGRYKRKHLLVVVMHLHSDTYITLTHHLVSLLLAGSTLQRLVHAYNILWVTQLPQMHRKI